jgi:hypothetical protein
MFFGRFNQRLFIGLLVFTLQICPAYAGEPGEREILLEYLYLDANEDQASGGHAAVRINNDVFHFQYNGGLLTMARDPWADFQLSYRGYQNRNIETSRLDISRDTFESIRASFVRRHLTQTRQIELVADARRDVELLQALLSVPVASLELPGFGFFEEPVSVAQGGRREVLRRSILAAHGQAFLRQRQSALWQRLAELPLEAIDIGADDFVIGTLPKPGYPLNQRYADIVAGLHAIDILRSDAGLSEQSLRLAHITADDAALLPQERDALSESADALRQRLLSLVSSNRPDWGSATLLALARLEAMRMSLESNRWIFIDILASDATIIDMGPRARQLLPQLQADARELWLNAREKWLQQPSWQENSYAAMEVSNANWLEIARLAGGASDWRLHTDRQVPRGLGVLAKPPQPLSLASAGVALLAQMQTTRQQAEQSARAQLGYQLLTRNCVSELFGTINIALANGLAQRGEPITELGLEQETQQRLGDVFTPSPIPFVSSSQVRQHWHVSDKQELLSLRRLYTRSQREGDSALMAMFRESNTLTSTVYQRSDEDSFFIFFTDGKAWVRPALGLVNLTAALGASVVGTVQWPFDGGDNLKAGLRGALFSLPELGFVNIRKGSSSWISPELRSVQVD